MRTALVGCGYVADFYATTFANHPELEIAGAFDCDPSRLKRFCDYYAIPRYPSLEALLEDDSIELVVNLTNPSSHYDVSRACLEAGKHVYSEKPLAVWFEDASRLVDLAALRGLGLASAPCGVLGESAQTAWRAIREGKIGRPLVVYAEMDDGLIHRTNYRTWISQSGAPWPWKDEFETGCTLEHAGYYVTWLAAFFGPATSVTSFAKRTIRDKTTDIPLSRDAPDLSVACIDFPSGPIARLTCSVVAPPDRSLRIIGDEGILVIGDCWDYGSPVYLQRRTPFTVRLEKKFPLLSRVNGIGRRRCRLVRPARFKYKCLGATRMDFARGVAELASSIRERRLCRLSAAFSLHVNEIVLAIEAAAPSGRATLKTSFEAPTPMPWGVSISGDRQPAPLRL